MFWTVRISAEYLSMETWQVYYLIAMGSVEAIKVSGAWRVLPEGVIEYDKQHPDRKNRIPGRDSFRGGSCEFLLAATAYDLPNDLPKRTGRLQGRRRGMVHYPRRRPKVLQQELKPISQLEFAF
jgi:hypothetical protein